MEIPQRAQRGVLHDVLSVVIVARQVARQRIRGVQMRQHDGFESLELARLQPVLGVGGPPVDRDSARDKNIPGGISTRRARSDRWIPDYTPLRRKAARSRDCPVVLAG